MTYTIKKAVITGATGAIGMALIQELISREIEVTVFVRGDSARGDRIPSSPLVKKVECALDGLRTYEVREGETYDVFFHFAWAGTTGDARNDMFLQNKNVEYTLDAVALAEKMGCHTFVGAGSQAEYGRVEGALSATTPAFPENGYGMAKLCAGQMSRVMCEKKGIRHLWARILSVYGPYDGANSLVMSTIRKIAAGEKPSCTAGEQIWDYLYSGDAAKAFVAMVERGVDGHIYCLGGGKTRMLREYIEGIRDAIDPDAPLGIGDLPYPPKQVMYLCADIVDLVQDTGFAPETTFEDGIRQTVAWYLGTQTKA